MRRRLIARAAVLIVIALAVAASRLITNTYAPRTLESYEASADARVITLSFCGSTAETIFSQQAREDARSVVVDIQLSIAREQFQNGTVHRVTFALGSPLGDRVVRDSNGTVVPHAAQYLCPG
jgi:hypothetical protein